VRPFFLRRSQMIGPTMFLGGFNLLTMAKTVGIFEPNSVDLENLEKGKNHVYSTTRRKRCALFQRALLPANTGIG
jgi:hypothetical protein